MSREEADEFRLVQMVGHRTRCGYTFPGLIEGSMALNTTHYILFLTLCTKFTNVSALRQMNAEVILSCPYKLENAISYK